MYLNRVNSGGVVAYGDGESIKQLFGVNNLVLTRFLRALKVQVSKYFNFDTMPSNATGLATPMRRVSIWVSAPDIDPSTTIGSNDTDSLGIIIRFTRHSFEQSINLNFWLRVECSIQFVFPQQSIFGLTDTSTQGFDLPNKPYKYSDVFKTNLCEIMYLALLTVPIEYTYMESVWQGNPREFVDSVPKKDVVHLRCDSMETSDPSVPMMHASYTIPVTAQVSESDYIKKDGFEIDFGMIKNS